jgi:hypothetical protein
MKHLKQESEILVKTPKIFENNCKHMQHLDETLANICMKHLQILGTYVCNMHVYTTSRSSFATSKKHLQHMFGTDEIFRTYT